MNVLKKYLRYIFLCDTADLAGITLIARMVIRIGSYKKASVKGLDIPYNGLGI